MRVCPNLSDPIVKSKWDALVADPELGKAEAMRELITAEKQNREMGTPSEVKAKLTERAQSATGLEDQTRIDKARVEILNKSNDPVYDDVDALMGAAIQANPINGKNLSVNANSNTRGMEILTKLSQQTGIPFAFISVDDAVKLTATAKNPYTAARGPAFFYGDTVYFIGGAVTTELAFHEIAHPIVRAIKQQNPALYDKLAESAILADRSLLTEALAEYEDLNQLMQAETDPEQKTALETKFQNAVSEEVIVKTLTRAALLKSQGQEPTTALGKVIKEILYSIKQALRKMFGQKVNVAKLDANTTVDELAQMLVAGENFEINTENVTQADVVAYFETNSRYIEDLKNIALKSGNEQIMTMTKRMYEGASQQVQMIMKNKNYSEMVNLFADEYNRGDLQEIRSNLAKYAKELEGKTADLAEDMERTRSEIQALVNSMLRLEGMMEKMEKHLDQLAKEPESQDSAHKAYYYSHVLGYWQKYIEETKAALRADKLDHKSPMMELLNNIEETMKRSAKTITEMNQKGVAEALWEQWSDMASRAEELFKEQIAALKKAGASKIAIDRKYIDFYGMTPEFMDKFKELHAMKVKGTLTKFEDIEMHESLEKKSFEGKQITKEKIERGLTGKGKDAHWTNSYLEGYLYNTDPVIGGFAMYFKNNMSDMEARAQSRLNDIASELEPLLKDAGISFAKIGDLGQRIGFIDSIGYFDSKTDEFTKRDVWTLLNPYKNYRHDIDKFNQDIKDLQNRYNKTGSAEDKTILADKLAEKAAHMRKYFHQEYVDSFYEKDDMLERDDIGRAAAYERKKILDKMNELTHPLTNEYDVLKTADQIEALWKEYRLLYSLYYPNGEKKTNSFVDNAGIEVITNDLAMAERLQAHRDHTRKFYEFKERPGVFQSALKNFEAETFQKLKDIGLVPGSEEFEDSFDTYRKEWLTRNTRIAIKPEFYAQRSAILQRIKAITSKLPSAQANEIDFSEHWKQILDVVSGYRDDDGQPVGSDMSEGRKTRVKEAQQAMEKAKDKWAGFSGLTREQMDELVSLAAKKNSGNRLTPDEYASYRELIGVQDSLGLDQFDRAELNSLFADLKELQRKEPTEYYVDSINHWLDTLDTETIFKEFNITEVNSTNTDRILIPQVLAPLFKQSAEFKAWFEKNHVTKKIYNKELGTEQTIYERLYIWNVIKPNNAEFYESTQITNEDGSIETIPGLPTLKYYARVVKKEYRTGYDSATGEVRPIIGIHKDNRGEFLPKDVADSPYRNEEYFKLKDASPDSEDGKLFKVLENITKNHLKNQDGVGKRGKLYLDFPRFEKSNLEALQTGAVGKKAAASGNALSLMFKRFKDFFRGAKADAGVDFNFKQQNMLVRADAFDDQIENIPIQGLFNLDTEETSTDIISSMNRYLYAAEHHKQLVKMNPIAKGLKNILESPDNLIKEADKINRSNFLNRGVTTYLNKTGKYVRKDAFNNFYEREFMAQTQTGAFKDVAWLQNIQKFLFKRASFSFFALNIPSAIKNAAGAKFQAMIESVGGNNINPASLVKGEAWSVKYMTKLSFGDAYAKGQKSLEHQLGEIFDPVQGRFEEKFGDSITRTMGKDAASMTWLYNFRKWVEIQASMQTFGAMMYKQKIPFGNTQIDYMDAWELNKDGKISLKAGVDPKWGITYDEEGNPIVGKEFKAFKSKLHVVMNKLNGAYSKFEQPEMQRYFAFRFLSYLRRFFTTMAINRFGFRRWNPGYGQIDEGYYLTAMKTFATIGRSRNFHDLTIEDRKAWMKMTAEIGALYMMGLIVSLFWGWDPDDEDRFEKLRQRSGHAKLPGTSENKRGEDFDMGGYLSLHAMSLMMQIRSENEQFIPLPSYGIDNMSTIIDLKSLAFGPTTDTYSQLAEDAYNTIADNDRQFYKRRAGPYEWQDKGGRKLWAHIAKMFGITGSSVDPAQGITNFQKSQNRKK